MGSRPCPVVEVSRAVSIFGMVERLEELKRKAAAEIERARQNVRDIRAVKKRVWFELARARNLRMASCLDETKFRRALNTEFMSLR